MNLNEYQYIRVTVSPAQISSNSCSGNMTRVRGKATVVRRARGLSGYKRWRYAYGDLRNVCDAGGWPCDVQLVVDAARCRQNRGAPTDRRGISTAGNPVDLDLIYSPSFLVHLQYPFWTKKGHCCHPYLPPLLQALPYYNPGGS